MKNRFLCGLLAVCLLVAMLPATVITASADTRTVSENLIAVLKQLEGFSANAYVSGGQWSIGYGTAGSPGQTITEAEADKALRDHLKAVEDKLNAFDAGWNLKLTQQQFDALASLSYNVGTGWMNTSGRLRDAITGKASEDKFLFGMSLWANNGTSPDPGLLQRRMAEADIYLNGVYGKKSGTYTYTIFDANGGTAGSGGEDKMQGYRRDGSTQILVADPTLSGCTFAGWFTQRSGGTRVTALDSSTAGVTLYAQYSSNGSTGWTGGTELEGSDGTTAVIAQGTVKCTSYVNVRKGPGTNYTILARAVAGSQVEIYQTKWVGASQWGRMTNGWICMDYVSLSSDSQSGSGSTDTQISGTVSGSNVNVRSGAGTGYSIVGRKNSGDVITVYERKTSGGLNWGRIGDNQWICLAYVRLENAGGTETPQPGSESNSSVSGDGTSAVQDTGTVSSTTGLNVRSGPGTGYARIKTLSPGTVVSLYEYRTVDGVRWGRIQASQWVCMTYVQLSSQSGAESEQTGTGKVISTTVLNIRSGPGTNYSRVGQLTPGTKIEITEQTKTNGVSWGKTAQGWVCMTYVKMG
ncbi:MAG: SH3 domain-containing protein [Candidatus Faecousia sp.]|nr:SH3 domain-containing protein [Candidatus Faecousia sp.]